MKIGACKDSKFTHGLECERWLPNCEVRMADSEMYLAINAGATRNLGLKAHD